jgi:hypothetical protein
MVVLIERKEVMARFIYQTEREIEDLAEQIDFNQALRIIKGFMGTEDTLDALKGFEKRYEKAELYAMEDDTHLDLDLDWRYEIFSYNLLIDGFSKLFAPKEDA